MRINGPSHGGWPPLRMSYADGRSVDPAQSAKRAKATIGAQPIDSSEREQKLSRELDERLSSTLNLIRVHIQDAATPSAYANPDQGLNPSEVGRRLDILA